jgi:hypothetical protein
MAGRAGVQDRPKLQCEKARLFHGAEPVRFWDEDSQDWTAL